MAKDAQGKRRTRLQIIRDRKRIGQLYLQEGLGQIEIAEILELSQPTVSRDLNALKDEWRTSSLVQMDEAIARELAKIDQLELDYYDAWARSKKPAIKRRRVVGSPSTKDGQAGAGETVQIITEREQRVGDSQFLRGVERCIAARRELLGLDAPIKRDVEFDYDAWMNERKSRLDKIKGVKPMPAGADRDPNKNGQ